MKRNVRGSAVFSAVAVSGEVLMTIMNVFDDFGLSNAAAHLSLALESAYREAGLDPAILSQLRRDG